MSYYLTTRPGRAATIPIGTQYDLSGYTLTVEIDDNESFTSPAVSGSASYSNSQVTVSFTSTQVDSMQDCYFRVKAVGSSTFYLASGKVNYLTGNPTAPAAGYVDSSGYLKEEAKPAVSLVTSGEVVGIVQSAATVNPTGAWNFTTAPKVNGTVIGTGSGVTAHGSLTGLSNDDHPQYLNNARGDARYVLQSASISADKVSDGTTNKTYTATEKTKLATVALNATANRTDATTDSLLALKAPLASPAFSGTPTGITKTHVGLGNADNTSDMNKPVSTAQQAAIELAKATGYLRVALWDGASAYAVNGVAVTASNRIPGTYYRFLNGPDPATVGLTVINGDEWLASSTPVVTPPSGSTTTVPSAPNSLAVVTTAPTSGANGTAKVTWKAPTSTGGTAILNYTVEIAPLTTGASAGFIGSADPNYGLEYTFTGLSNGNYRFNINAVNAQGVGPTTTSDATVGAPVVIDNSATVPAPTTFTVSSISGGLSVDWNDVTAPGNNFGRYEYRYGTTNPPTGTPVATGYTSAATITGLTVQAYYLQVRSVSTSEVAGSWSTVQGPYTPSTPPATGSRLPELQPFASDSPWNLPVSNSATYESSTGSITNALRNIWGPYAPGMNWDRYSHPVNLASSSDPVNSWIDKGHGDEITRVNTPSNVFIATGTDKHCHIIQPNKHYLDEFFAAEKNTQYGTDYVHYRHARVDLYGKGIGPQGGTRAYGGSAIGGLIRQWEVDQSNSSFKSSGLTVDGRAVPLITHALAIALINEQLKAHTPTAYDFSYDANGYSKNTNGYVWPATETDGDGPWNYKGTIPMGQYFVLDKDVNISSLGLGWAGTALALAAQNYGIYTTDRSGQTVFYMEVSANPSQNVRDFVNSIWNSGDVGKILKQCRAVTNNSASTPNGGAIGSARRASLASNLS
jgi:hypothetical protein